ncbi:hypothetical protein SAMN05892883_1491 [Jatrophihabitans sp. GAS493]|uniref:DUF5313 family protein n=1 Tax=Jatrophihabitans sp. GAS493 TaxID=1907575 RepID=UPI000BBF6B2C|nr:DUF5313 family protein [Jatrophihabitans sp. GAS493]SOD72050.1 hypothetical protein SAMN05892883_1491 [Jatrophihabitans sp. GAS493]
MDEKRAPVAEPSVVPQRSRPNAVEWLRYAWGGGLPPSLRDWVLKDLTGRTWLLRQSARSIVLLAPFAAAILIFVPGAFWIRGVAVIGGTFMGLLFGFAYVVETSETRLLRAGYPAGLGERIRRRRAAEAHSAGVARRREKRARKSPAYRGL